MITTDPTRRAALREDVIRLASSRASDDDRPLLEALVPAVFDQIPDSLVFRLSAETLAARMADYLRFVAHTMPPEVQLYKGLPGLHVSVRNPDGDDAGQGDDGRLDEVTIVETHTPDAPFIFESLKNFFQNEGLRVFSAIHPRLTVRRQWEHVVYVGPHGEDGSQELFCQFRIERIDRTDKLRRLEHQIFSLLKSVFLAVDDFKAMMQVIAQLGPRLRARGADDPAQVASAQRFLEWLTDDNFVMLGLMRYQAAADGSIQPVADSALGAFQDLALLPTVFPGLPDDIERNLTPPESDRRIVDIDYCVRGRAIHHLEPLEDIFVREWNDDGSLAAMTLLIGRFAKSAFAAKAQHVPLLEDKLAYLLETSGLSRNSHAYREARAIFNHFPKRELFYATATDLKAIIEQMVHMVGDDEIAATVREGTGYAAAVVAFSDIRYSFKAAEELRRLLSEAFGTILFSEWADCGTKAAIIYYFDAAQLETPLDVDTVRQLTARAIATWEDLVSASLDEEFGTLEGRRLFRKYVRHDTRSGLYRESTSPDEVAEDVRHFERLEARLEMSVQAESADSVIVKLYAPKPLGLTQTLQTLQHLALPVVEELSLPLLLPEGRSGFLERLRIKADPRAIAAVNEAPDRLLDALRALHEGRATDDPLNGLITLEGLGWRQVEVLRTLRNHLVQIRSNYNAETVTAVMLRNSAASAALWRLFAARFDPTTQDDRDGALDRADNDLRGALQQVDNLLDDEVLRGLQSLVEAAVRTNVYQKPERPVISIKVECAKVAGMVSPRPLYEIYVHSPYLEGIHLRGGKVARGGIRWSDRHDDFRTEVLGLMKTQMVKNAIIVPVGSKGGFVLKGSVPARPALDQYLIDRYRQFVSGLLDVTDNIDVSLDYYNIALTDRINFISPSDLINRLTTGDPIPAGLSVTRSIVLQPNGQGRITGVIAGYANEGDLDTSGLDFTANANVRLGPLGDLKSAFEVTYILDYKIDSGRDLTGDPAVPQYRATLDNTWRPPLVTGLTVAFNGNHIADQAQRVDASGNKTGHIPSYTTWDLQVGYDLPLLAGGNLAVGAINIFNKEPSAKSAFDGRDFNYYLYDQYGTQPYIKYIQKF